MNQDALWQILRKTPDIDPSINVVEAGRIRHIEVSPEKIYVLLAIPYQSEADFHPLRDKIESVISQVAQPTQKVLVGMTAMKSLEENKPQTQSNTPSFAKNVIAVGSGKGGVGKSTVSLGIAVALATFHGLRVGILDADVHGPSIPHLMQYTSSRPQVINNKLIPFEKWNVKAMSLGMLVEKDAPSILRGPMMGRAVEQMIDDVQWPPLDVFIIDFPPGTGDVHLSSFRKIAVKGCVIVSTPQDLALLDARKMMAMCDRLNVPILGCVENMSGFLCPQCGKVSDIFGKGALKQYAKQQSVPYLGAIPLHLDVRTAGDKGENLILNNPSHPVSLAFSQIVDALLASIEVF